MAIDWSNEKREILREALQDAYTDYDLLEMFVDEKLDESLPEIAEKAELNKVVYKLLKWARTEKRLDELFQKFCEANPRIKDTVIAKLQLQPLVNRSANLFAEDWESLFSTTSPDDSPYMQIAFHHAFKVVYGRSFREIRPDSPSVNNLDDIQDLLTKYDNPTFAVRFVECAIAELCRSSEGSNRDLTALEQWRDRISQQHNVSKQDPEPIPTIACHAYLLVVLDEIGSDVNVYPELHITGVESPIRFGAQPTTCTIDKVADQIGKWINQAEGMPEIRQCESSNVVLELFLPYKLLEEDIGTYWKVRDEWEDTINLEDHRHLLVRSSDRILKTKLREALIRNWEQLERDVEAGNGCIKFRHQDVCLERGKLPALLEDHKATGLKLTAKLPVDRGDRHDVLKDIVKAAIPIALWSSETVEAEVANLKTEFDNLLKCHLTNFADLAKQWRIRRREGSQIAKHIKLLCDHPHRMPKPPDSDREEDLLVAS